MFLLGPGSLPPSIRLCPCTYYHPSESILPSQELWEHLCTFGIFISSLLAARIWAVVLQCRSIHVSGCQVTDAFLERQQDPLDLTKTNHIHWKEPGCFSMWLVNSLQSKSHEGLNQTGPEDGLLVREMGLCVKGLGFVGWEGVVCRSVKCGLSQGCMWFAGHGWVWLAGLGRCSLQVRGNCGLQIRLEEDKHFAKCWL